MSGELTAGEKAYLESGGTDTAALLAENPSAGAPAAEVAAIHRIEPDPAPAPAPVATEKPAAEAAAATAPVAEPTEPGEEEIPAADGKTKRRMVDSRALKAERLAKQAIEAELRAERETRARVDERLKMLSEAIGPIDAPANPDPEPAVIPDPEADIFGYARHLAQELETLKKGQQAAQAETAEERQTRATISTYTRDRDVFVAKQSDFMEGYNFLLSARKSQLELQGYSEEEVSRWLLKEEMDLVNRSLQNKKSPSEQIYALAKSMGYAQKQPAAAPAAVAPVAPAAVAAARPAPAAPLGSVTDEIDRIKAGQAAAMSLSNGGGGGAQEMSLEWLANAPMKEFEAFMNKPGNREKVEKAMGRRAA